MITGSALLAQNAPDLSFALPSSGDAEQTLARAQRQSADAAARAARLDSASTAAADDAERIEARASATAARIQAAEADIAAAEARIAIIETAQRAQRARLAAQQGPSVRLVAALQILGLRPPSLALVQPGSLDDLVHARAILATVRPAIDARTAGLRADVARGIALRRQASAALTDLASGQKALVAQRTALSALAAERRRAADALSGSAMLEQDRAMAMGEEARDIGDLVGQLSDAAGIRARLETLSGPVLRPLRPGDPRPAPVDASASGGQAPYRLPVIGTVVAGLGEVSASGVRARGLTIATHADAQVVAPTGGRIAFAGSYRGYGNIVIIDHGGGWTTLITGLAALDVRVGNAVSQGSPLGRAGAGAGTGTGTGRPMITVELRRQGTPVDIARLIG